MESVLCVERKDWEEFLKLQGFSKVDYKSLKRLIDEKSLFVNRAEAETDINLKQIIPHCMIRSGSEYYVCKRIGGVEDRIREELSIGFGGHIDNSDKGEYLLEGLLREVYEEIEPPVTKQEFAEGLKFVGVTNDETQFVSSLHVGIWFEYPAKSKEFSVLEKEKIEGVWLGESTIVEQKEKFESWSRYLIDDLV